MWNTICVRHGLWCFHYVSVTVCYALGLYRSPSVLYLLCVGHGLLCSGLLSVRVCVIFTTCRSRSVMLWTPVGHGLLCFEPLSVTVCYALALCQSQFVLYLLRVGHGLLWFYYVSVTVCYAFDLCRSRSVMFTTCRSRSVGGAGGGGSKFSTLNFNTLFQIVFHKTVEETTTYRRPFYPSLNPAHSWWKLDKIGQDLRQSGSDQEKFKSLLQNLTRTFLKIFSRFV